MPLRNDILQPIPGSNPGGEDLHYAPIFDKIKEARREEDDVPQGDWARERKMADWPLVIKLSSEALATKSKDVQLAAWLTEALLRKEGVAGLKEGLDLLHGLIETFWDNLYPELEDGDAEFRATPVQWVGDRLEQAIKRAPLTRSGLDWFQYKESRTVGYEEDAATEDKRQARQTAIDDNKITGELWDAAFNGTPKAYYVALEQAYDAALESLESLGQLSNDKFGEYSPNFGKLRGTLEEVRQSVHILLQKKREKEPDEPVPGEEPASWETGGQASEEERLMAEGARAQAGAAAAAAPARRVWAGPEPVDREDAASRVIVVARYLRREDPYSPAPYLMLRGLRWGELRAAGETVDPSMLAAPPTSVRQGLKRMATEGTWAEVMEAAETAMGEPYGRGWLDLQRYTWRACYEQGSYYDPIANAIRSATRALLADLPGLTALTLADDTPTANAETVAWIAEHVGAASSTPQGMPEAPSMDEERREEVEGMPDPYELAMQAVRSGRPEDGIQILAAEMVQERSSRARFNRKVQLAQLCLGAGHFTVAHPILMDLAAEIERRKLEDWEAAEVIAHPLVLLYRCLAKVEGPTEEDKQRLYARICCLDPIQALACSR
jgi:type VI secretion system protein ImpA